MGCHFESQQRAFLTLSLSLYPYLCLSPSPTGSASRQPLNFRTAQNGQNTLANWLFATIAVATATAAAAVAATSLLLITTNSNCQRFVRVLQLPVPAPAPTPSSSTSPVLVGALFVANCLWRQRYKENKCRRCRHKQMQLHTCPMPHVPCPMSGSSAKSGPFVSLPQKW